jgi:hypothetical protein
VRRTAAALLAMMAVVAGCADRPGEVRRPRERPIEVRIAPPAVEDRLSGSQVELVRRYPAWRTDLDRRVVEIDELVPATPRDAIPPLSRPRTVAVASAAGSLDAAEPMLVIELGGRARAYPLRILIWHEVVNDRIGGRPVVVTYCPLCNSSVVFDRRVEGRTLSFGTSGRLRRANLVMWDRQTESWWQQITGRGLVGRFAGARLEPLPSQTVPFGAFARAHPHGTVMSTDTVHDRRYGESPYPGYQDRARPGLFSGRLDLRIPPMTRVLTVHGRRETLAVPFPRLRRSGPLNVRLGRRPVVVWWAPGLRSVLDTPVISEAADVGAVGAFVPRTRGRELTFSRRADGAIVDAQTGTRWDITGRGRIGPLHCARVRPVHHDALSWFALAALEPRVRLIR